MNPLAAALLALGILLALLFVYPYVLYPKILRLLPEKPTILGTQGSGDGSGFALLFAAHNEAASLPATLENLRAIRKRYPRIEIHAYSDDSTDGTPEIIENADLGIHVTRSIGRTGKAHGMKTMAARASAEYLIFIDANVLLDVDAIDNLARIYTDTTVGGVCGRLVYLNATDSVTASTGDRYWRLEDKIKQLESRSGSTMGADGSIFSVRHSLYPEFPDCYPDDFVVSMSVIFQGYRLVHSSAVVAYEDEVVDEATSFARKVRISTRAFGAHRWMAPRRSSTLSIRDHFCYASHKVLRWNGAFLLIAAYAAFKAGLFIASPLVATTVMVGTAALLAIASRWRVGIAASCLSVLGSVIATGWGTLRARRGVIQQTWSPPREPSKMADS